MSMANVNGLPFQKKKFDKNTYQHALSCLTYGVKVHYSSQDKQIIVYQSEVDIQLLVLLDRKNQAPNKLNVLDMRDIIDIQEEAPNTEFNSKDCLMVVENKIKHYFIFSSEDKKNLFWQGLQYLIEKAAAYKQETMRLDYVKQMALDLYSKADTDLSANLTYKEGYMLLQQLNINILKKELYKKFEEFNNKDKLIKQEEFIKVARELLQKEELKDIFKKHVPNFNDTVNLNQKIMTKKDFFKFLQNEQKQTQIDETLETFINVFFADKQGQISYHDFTNLIFNYHNSIYDPSKLNIYQSMDQPLTDYYINSSHNTYLMANQLTGISSVEAYINAFRKGCRCIEIDAWDGKNEPIVTHGFTLTSSIKFKDIIQVIQKYGFVWSKYPIIMSIENHCNKENQLQMAAILKEILGSQLFLIPDDHASVPFYPTPKQLKRRIIVKAKDVMPSLNSDKVQQENKYSQEPMKINNSDQQDSSVGQELSIGQDSFDLRKQPPSLEQNRQSDEQISQNTELDSQNDKQNSQQDEQIVQTVDQKIKSTQQNDSSVQQKVQNVEQKVNNDEQNDYIIERDENPQKIRFNLEHSHSSRSKKSSKDIKDLLEEVEEDNHKVEKQEVPLSKQFKSYKSFHNENQENDDCQDCELIIDEKTKEKILQVKDFQKCISLVGIGFNIDVMKHQKLSIFDIISLSETKIKKLMLQNESVIIKYHKRFFSRIYPKGSRVDSSNYDPLPSFCSGAQIIALNFQTSDSPLFIYLSKFQQNGGIYSGYVLKPKFLCHDHQQDSDLKDHSQCNHQLHNYHKLPSQLTIPIKELRITIISGQCLKQKAKKAKQYNPFVQVSIKGTQADESNNKVYRTRIVPNNTFHPIYDSFPMIFKISCPQLAMVSFQVFNSGLIKESVIAQYALDFDCIREGIRVIPLWDKHLQKIEHGLLLAQIEILDHKI